MMPQPPWRTLSVLAVVLVALTSAALAQKPPKRPQLPAGADSNDAGVYYQYGVQNIQKHPRVASEAFYWAHRLAPDWPDPLYARWVASLLSQTGRLPEYMNGERHVVDSKGFRAIDSLYYAALELNPFMFRPFDRMLFDEYLEVYAQRYESRTGRMVNRGLLFAEFDEEVLSAPALRGWMSYAQGRFGDAVVAYGNALKGARYKAGLFAARSRASFSQGDYAAALADMQAALEERRKTEDKNLVVFYDSKALFEHSIGVIHEMMQDPAGAREAYARALQEDLSYHQGHVRLAAMALGAGDTAAAVSEYDLAAQIQPKDPVVRHQLGILLGRAGRHAEAVEHYLAAVAAEPLYAPPYLGLGRAYEALGKPDKAREQYQAFVARTRQNDPNLAWAKQRLNALPAAP